MKPFTVVLLYPPYSTPSYGEDIYVASAEAENIACAVEEVQKKASDDCKAQNVDIPQWDFKAILILEGNSKCVGDAQGFDDGSHLDEGACDTSDMDYREALEKGSLK